jgi:hypothetical protein
MQQTNLELEPTICIYRENRATLYVVPKVVECRTTKGGFELHAILTEEQIAQLQSKAM